MRISDWSSDVCSSDLGAAPRQFHQRTDRALPRAAGRALMGTNISPLAGKPAQAAQLVNVDKLLAAYFDVKPDPSVAAQRVAFGTSGQRGSSFDGSLNRSEEHKSELKSLMRISYA